MYSWLQRMFANDSVSTRAPTAAAGAMLTGMALAAMTGVYAGDDLDESEEGSPEEPPSDDEPVPEASCDDGGE